ncbi:hypothetical protein ACPXCP_39940 [Streptomyces sp. DT20]|uniref:hypothetical protein n=1 Tax=Streptomyces sp. DT20 TaxID=3416519 RepID=UPI003CF8B14F
MNLAALTTGSQFKDWAFAIGGNAFGVILLIRCGIYFFREDWGKLTTCLFGAVFVVGAIYFPDAMRSMLGGVWSKISEESVTAAAAGVV